MAREEQVKKAVVNDRNKLFMIKITVDQTLSGNKKTGLRVRCCLPATE